jgi:hypothetical protein
MTPIGRAATVLHNERELRMNEGGSIAIIRLYDMSGARLKLTRRLRGINMEAFILTSFIISPGSPYYTT